MPSNEKESSDELSFFMGLKFPNKHPPFSQNPFTNLRIYGILTLNENYIITENLK